MKTPSQQSENTGSRSTASSLINHVRLAYRTDALFRALSADSLLREQFVTDPARVLADYALDFRLSEEIGEAANQLVYAVMSNRRLTDWLVSYGRRTRGELPSRHDFAAQFARAI